MEREVCWWGDMALLPHFLNLLAKKTISATITFGNPILAGGDRKELSQILHREVLRLHGQAGSNAKTGVVDSVAVSLHSE